MNKNMCRILLVSLVLNLVCVGLIGGHFLRAYFFHQSRFQAMHNELKQILPEEKLAVFEESMKRHFQNRRDSRPQTEAAHAKMEQIITAPTFDQEAFRAQLEEINTMKARAFSGMGQSLLELLPTLTLEERKQLAEYLKQRRSKGFGMRRWSRHGVTPEDCSSDNATSLQKQTVEQNNATANEH